MKVKELSNYLESLAPLSYQESYDNCGLLVGSDQMEITKALVTLDCTEEVVREAMAQNCNLIIAHHPVIFGGIKKINGKNDVERYPHFSHQRKYCHIRYSYQFRQYQTWCKPKNCRKTRSEPNPNSGT
jgi:hypothetical protein